MFVTFPGFTGEVTFDLIILQLDNHGIESEFLPLGSSTTGSHPGQKSENLFLLFCLQCRKQNLYQLSVCLFNQGQSKCSCKLQRTSWFIQNNTPNGKAFMKCATSSEQLTLLVFCLVSEVGSLLFRTVREYHCHQIHANTHPFFTTQHSRDIAE